MKDKISVEVFISVLKKEKGGEKELAGERGKF